MAQRPAVSVITPLYNKRSTIERTIDSVLAQTFQDFELLIIDDGSTDGGGEFVKERYSDRRIRVHRQSNAGPGAARNFGDHLARGELETFLDADDSWRPQLLERAVTMLRKHPECAVFTSAFYLEPAGVDRWQEFRGVGFTEGIWALTPQTQRHELAHCLDAFHPTTAVYRREVIKAYGGFYTAERCTFGEDVYLWIQILLNHPIYRHMEPLAHYHTEDSQLGIGGRRGALPLEPVLTAPEPIRAVCPPALRPNLELWLAQHASQAAFMQLERGDPANAAWLLKAFPRIRAWRADYLKLRLRMASPTLWRLARGLRVTATAYSR